MSVQDFSTPAQKTAADLALLLARIPLGAYFMLAGVNKVKAGTAEFVSGAAGSIPEFLPTFLGRGYLHALPWMEIVVGVCLILGLFTRFTGLLMSLMLTSFMIAVTGVKPAGGGPFHYNLVYLGLALCFMLVGPGRLSIDALWPARRKKPH